MALKTILVHIADDPDHEARLNAAQALAKKHGAHLTALYITRPLGVPGQIAGRGLSLAFLEGKAEKAMEVAREAEGEFREQCTRSGLTHDWIVEDSEHLDALARHAHAADLIIVSRAVDEHLEDRFRLRLSEELVMVTGLPILVLQPGFQLPADGHPIGNKVLIAWKPTREAVRAVRDSLSILRTAEKVVLTTVRPTGEDAISTLEVVQYLKRQDVTLQTIDVDENSDGTGATILATAEAHGCDLIVAGAYGHSRMRELLFGGVTRRLFRDAEVPLLLSH